MTIFQRFTLSAVVLASSVLFILLLTFAGAHSQGPLSRTLTSVGASVSDLELRAVQLLRGPGRAADLSWLHPYRTNTTRLRWPAEVLVGAYADGLPASLEGVIQVERALGTTLPLIQLYTAWGDKPRQEFPWRTARAISDLGSIPVVTWEPWLTDFENLHHPHLPLREERDRGGLAAIARGDYDFYIDRWAAEAAAFGKPFFLRFAHEMNDPYRYPWGPHHNPAEDFIAAWKHVVDRFRAAGAHNVLWVWAPHLAYDFLPYYPGNDYVDWVGTGVLNYGTVAYWSQWWSFEEIFSSRYETLAAYGKPIMIAEFGSLSIGGDREAWFRASLENLPDRYPAVKALLFFHASNDATVTYQRLDWSFAQDTTLSQTIARSLLSWIPGPDHSSSARRN